MKALKIGDKYLSINNKLIDTSGEGIIAINRDIILNNGKVIIAPQPIPTYLTFSSPAEFSLKYVGSKYWDGAIQYSTDTTTWNVYDNTDSEMNSVNGKLYIRGIGNTRISQNYNYGLYSFQITGNNVSFTGNLENLLDYQTVANGSHPTISKGAFSGLFGTGKNTPLIRIPDISATTLPNECFDNAFSNCVNITTTMKLPAMNIEQRCYVYMFAGCTSLITIPKLPATQLQSECYAGMFADCKSLKFSETQTDECPNPYRIPSEGIGIAADYATIEMFRGTSGTFTGTPEINKTYYTNATVI